MWADLQNRKCNFHTRKSVYIRTGPTVYFAFMLLNVHGDCLHHPWLYILRWQCQNDRQDFPLSHTEKGAEGWRVRRRHMTRPANWTAEFDLSCLNVFLVPCTGPDVTFTKNSTSGKTILKFSLHFFTISITNQLYAYTVHFRRWFNLKWSKFCKLLTQNHLQMEMKTRLNRVKRRCRPSPVCSSTGCHSLRMSNLKEPMSAHHSVQ